MQLQLQTWVEVEAYLRLSRRVIVPISSSPALPTRKA